MPHAYPNIDACVLNDDGTVDVAGRFISVEERQEEALHPNPDAPTNTQLVAFVTQPPTVVDDQERTPSGSGGDTFTAVRHQWAVTVSPVDVPFTTGWAWVTAVVVRAYNDATSDTANWSRWVRIDAPS